MGLVSASPHAGSKVGSVLNDDLAALHHPADSTRRAKGRHSRPHRKRRPDQTPQYRRQTQGRGRPRFGILKICAGSAVILRMATGNESNSLFPHVAAQHAWKRSEQPRMWTSLPPGRKAIRTNDRCSSASTRRTSSSSMEKVIMLACNRSVISTWASATTGSWPRSAAIWVSVRPSN